MDNLAPIDTLSTELDTDAGPSAGGGGAVVEQAEPQSIRADLEAAFKEDTKAPEPKVEPKPEPEAKQEPDKPETEAKEAEEKPASEDAPAKQPEAKEEQPKGERKFVEAPQSFMPKAKEVWRNTPHAVQAEVARMAQEHEAASEQTRQTVERYESLKQYDELARTNGRDLRESLEKMTHVENMLQRNPVAGLNAILMEIGPKKADGQPFSLYEIAQFIAQQDPQNYQQMVAQPPEQPKQDPQVAQLQQEVATLREQQTQASIVEPFKQAHPRFDELERDIAFFLQSGRIPESLSPGDKLAAAYDMAERINPPSHVDDLPEPSGRPAEQRRAVDDLSGSKSIKSSPGSVSESYEPKAKRGESARDSLMAEMRRMNR